MKLLSTAGAAIVLLTALAPPGNAVEPKRSYIINSGPHTSARDCTREGGKVSPSTSGRMKCNFY